MTYHAVVDFVDLQDENRFYHAGDPFPREGKAVSAERFDELATNKNRMGYPLIAPDPAKTKAKRTKKGSDANAGESA